MSSFLLKETNYTKLGKTVKGKKWNSYQQMLKSIRHSLRLDNIKNIHIIKNRTKDNIIVSNIEESLLYDYIQNKISKNIKDYENIDMDENKRKKLFKDFTNAKSAISKKVPLDIIETELKTTSNEKEILKNCVYKHKLKNLKARDKRTLKTLKRYIELKSQYEKEKQHKKYNNQVLLKEVLFKVPTGQKLNLNNDQWKIIIDKFKKKYFDEYEMFFSAIHNDEGVKGEIKGHVHMFLSGFNNDTKEFDIKRNLFEKISKIHNLDLDYNNKENHKKIMNLFQEDFYDFFNAELAQMGIKERIELNEYQTIDELNKRLQIKKEDYLTIDERHEKLANKIIEEKFIEFDKNNRYKNLKFEISENLLSNSLSIKTNLKNDGTNRRVKLFTKMLKISQYFSEYVKKLENKIIELKELLLAKSKEIMNLNAKLEQQAYQQSRDMRNLENNLKEQYEKEKSLEIKKIVLEKNTILEQKDKELESLKYRNSDLFNMKMRYKKFEKVFGINISKRLKEYRNRGRMDIDRDIA